MTNFSQAHQNETNCASELLTALHSLQENLHSQLTCRNVCSYNIRICSKSLNKANLIIFFLDNLQNTKSGHLYEYRTCSTDFKKENRYLILKKYKDIQQLIIIAFSLKQIRKQSLLEAYSSTSWSEITSNQAGSIKQCFVHRVIFYRFSEWSVTWPNTLPCKCGNIWHDLQLLIAFKKLKLDYLGSWVTTQKPQVKFKTILHLYKTLFNNLWHDLQLRLVCKGLVSSFHTFMNSKSPNQILRKALALCLLWQKGIYFKNTAFILNTLSVKLILIACMSSTCAAQQSTMKIS